MKRIILSAATLLLAAVPLFAAAPTAQQILDEIDRSRNGWISYVVDVKISNFRQQKAVDDKLYQVFIKGPDHSLVKFMSSTEKGKSLLMLEEAMWLFLPTAGRPIRVTPLQRLSGNASNGDVAQTSLTANYTSDLKGEEPVAGRPAWILDLTAKRKSATYQHVRLWIDQETRLPVTAEFRLTSGKPMKRVEYVQYVNVAGGGKLLKQQILYDLLRKEQKTIIDYGNYTQRDLPDKLFNKNSLR
jgi:outer membrane lipoprotein-sorting protein